jgi:hypothetical protein
MNVSDVLVALISKALDAAVKCSTNLPRRNAFRARESWDFSVDQGRSSDLEALLRRRNQA